MEYDNNILEERFKQLHPDLQTALTSTSITEEIKQIADTYGLKIDQEGVLYDQIAYIILGLVPSNQFVKNFSKDAGVDMKTAVKVAEDINLNVLSKIRHSIQTIEYSESPNEEVKESSISTLEQVGGFSVDKEEKTNEGSVTAADKNDILDGLENPTPSAPVISKKSRVEEPHVEAMVDHLLSKPTAQPQQIVVQNPVAHTAPAPANLPIVEPAAPKKVINLLENDVTPTAPSAPPAPAVPVPLTPKPPRNDLYREPIK